MVSAQPFPRELNSISQIIFSKAPLPAPLHWQTNFNMGFGKKIIFKTIAAIKQTAESSFVIYICMSGDAFLLILFPMSPDLHSCQVLPSPSPTHLPLQPLHMYYKYVIFVSTLKLQRTVSRCCSPALAQTFTSPDSHLNITPTPPQITGESLTSCLAWAVETIPNSYHHP